MKIKRKRIKSKQTPNKKQHIKQTIMIRQTTTKIKTNKQNNERINQTQNHNNETEKANKKSEH